MNGTSKTHMLLDCLLDEVSDILALKQDDAKPPHRLAERVLKRPRLAKVFTGFLVTSKKDAKKLDMLESQIRAALVDLDEGKTAAAITILHEWCEGLNAGSKSEFPTTLEQVFICAAREAKCTRADIGKILLELARSAERSRFKNFPGPPASRILTKHLTDPTEKTP